MPPSPREATGSVSTRKRPSASAPRATAPRTAESCRTGAGSDRADSTPARPPAPNASRAKKGWGEVLPGEGADAEDPRAEQGHRHGDRAAVGGAHQEEGAGQDQQARDDHGGVEDRGRRLAHHAVRRPGAAEVADRVHVGRVGRRVQRLGGDDPEQDDRPRTGQEHAGGRPRVPEHSRRHASAHRRSSPRRPASVAPPLPASAPPRDLRWRTTDARGLDGRPPPSAGRVLPAAPGAGART